MTITNQIYPAKEISEAILLVISILRWRDWR